MKLSLGLILEELQFEIENPLSENPSFASAELYILGASDLSGNSLLICPLSEALMVPSTPGVYFLCVRDRMVDAIEDEDSMRSICVVKRNIDLRELYNAVHRVFLRLETWAVQMKESVMKNRGLQELMDLSEPIIGNHIAVMDAAFRLMAHTKNVATDDEVANALVRNGGHPEETVQRFLKGRRIEQFETADESGLIVSEDRYMSEYVTVKKIYKHNETFFIIVVMVCCARYSPVGVLELYRILLDHVQYYVEREYPTLGGRTPTEALFCELIEKSLHQEEDARKRAAYLKIPFEGDFDLNLMVFNDTINVPVSRVVREISATLPDAKVILYGRDILILNIYRDAERPTQASRSKRVWKLMGEQITCCGISNPFHSLWGLALAYEQARAAAALGEKLRYTGGEEPEEPGPHDYYYEEYYLHHLVQCGLDTLPDVFANSFAFHAIKKLMAYDEKHKTNNIQLIKTYLDCERNATDTCALLHLHRNTVLYHIGRVEEELGIKLDDPDVRKKLQVGFKAYELGRVQAGTMEEEMMMGALQ